MNNIKCCEYSLSLIKFNELLNKLLPNKYIKSSCLINIKKGAINVHNIDASDAYLEIITKITQIVKVIAARYGLIAAIAPAVVIMPLPPIHLVLSFSFM